MENIQNRLMVKLELPYMMYEALMLFIILECLNFMRPKKVTIYKKLKLIAYQFHP